MLNQPAKKKSADISHFKSHPKKQPKTAQVVASDYRSRAGLHALRLTEPERSKASKMLLIANVHLQGQLGQQEPYGLETENVGLII